MLYPKRTRVYMHVPSTGGEIQFTSIILTVFRRNVVWIVFDYSRIETEVAEGVNSHNSE